MTSERITLVVSFIFNPTVIAAFAFLVVLYPENTLNSFSLMGICLTFGTFVPLAMIHQLSKRGMVSDFFVSEKQ